MINIFNKYNINLTNINCKKAFTLAEVLITLGIIGVVAAMTLPNLVANYRSKVAVTQLKKMYSVLSEALLFTVQRDGDYSSLSVIGDSLENVESWYYDALKPYLKITQECFNKAGCWADTGTKLLNGGTPKYDSGNKGIGYGIVVFNTIDGYSVSVDTYRAGSDGEFWGVGIDSGAFIVIYVDINGKKLPNVIGKDTFAFVFSDRGFVPAGRNKSDEEINSDCSKNGQGYYCFEKIMRNGWEIDKNNVW